MAEEKEKKWHKNIFIFRINPPTAFHKIAEFVMQKVQVPCFSMVFSLKGQFHEMFYPYFSQTTLYPTPNQRYKFSQVLLPKMLSKLNLFVFSSSSKVAKNREKLLVLTNI